MRRTSKKRHYAIALLLLTGGLLSQATAQETTPRSRIEKAKTAVKEYVKGEPWTFDGTLSVTHRELLVGLGQVGVLDQYISPTAHTGADFALYYGTDFPPFAPGWHVRQEVTLGTGLPKNRANGSQMYVPRLFSQTALPYTLGRWGNLRLEMGPALSLLVQGNIKAANSNNVANAKVSSGIDGWGRLSYRIPWEILPMRLSYSASIPLLHAAFHPEYGESYYEYVSGDNRKWPHLYLTAPHNSLALRQQLLLELPIHSLTWVIGMQHQWIGETINHTKYRYGSVGLLIGVTLDSASFSGGRILRSSQLRSSY